MDKYLELQAEHLRCDMEKATINDKVKPIQKHIAMMQAEIKRAEIAIQSLLHEKDSLKSALSASVKKKEEIFKVLLQYKESLGKANNRILDLESSFDEVQIIKNEIDKVKKQVIRRDERIKALQARNEDLENLINQQVTHGSVLKKMYSESTCDPPEPTSLSLAVDIMLQKVKTNSHFHRLFKLFSPCINSFRDLIERNKVEDALVKTCKFCGELMKDIERISFRDMSPGMSESQGYTSSFNVTGHTSYGPIDEKYLNFTDDERCKILNAEISNVCNHSKALLLNKSYEGVISNEKLKSSNLNKNDLKSKKSEEKLKPPENPENSKTPRNSSRRPQQKIEIKTPEVKISRSNPRQSILKRNQ
jgi:hypothetical protein